MLHGRDREQAQLCSLAEAARHGQAGSVVLLGEPGIGKTALLDDLVAQSPQMRVLRTQGLQSEAPLPYAALHRLLRPLNGFVDTLPGRQADALRAAFGQSSGTAEPFVVGVAALSVLTSAAEAEPLLCVVDDAHWLDAASRDALLFVARRVDADRIAMIFAARDAASGPVDRPFDAEGLNILELDGLDAAAVHDLLAEHSPAASTTVGERLLVETGGNPLALLELPTALSPAQLQGAEPMPEHIALTARVEQVFLNRARLLSEPAQTFLLTVVADSSGSLHAVQRAASSLGVGQDAASEVEVVGLVVTEGDMVSVRHPLVRSAIYQAADVVSRREVHTAIAGALVALGQPERAIWHRASAAEGPDDDLADAMADLGARSEQRGGQAAAADAFARAADLSTRPEVRVTRRLAAARNAWTTGQSARASSLLAAARGELADDPLVEADLERLRGRIAMNAGSAPDAHRIFISAAQRVAPHDPVRALEMAVISAIARSHGVDSGAALEERTVSVEPTAEDTARTRCLKLMLASARDERAGDSSGAQNQLDEAMATALGAPETMADLDLLGNLGNAALHLGDDPASRRFYTLMLSGAREAGNGMAVLYALQRLTFSLYLTGDWAELRSTCEECVTLGSSLGQSAQTATPRAWLTVLAAHRGNDDYEQRLTDVEDLIAANPPVGILAQPVRDLTRWARAIQALHGGDATGALHHLRQIQQPALTAMAAQDRIDVAVRAGHREQALAWIRELESLAARTDAAWARAAISFGHAITVEPAASNGHVDPDEHFEAALRHHAEARRPYDRARAELGFGEHLRRAGRRVDARQHLRTAVETFQDLRAHPWVDRANAELRASGETARKRNPSTALNLTPMERKVAQLVSQGLSNKDVAAQCWVSPRTVAFHLRNVFTKAGITSRGELAGLDLA